MVGTVWYFIIFFFFYFVNNWKLLEIKFWYIICYKAKIHWWILSIFKILFRSPKYRTKYIFCYKVRSTGQYSKINSKNKYCYKVQSTGQSTYSAIKVQSKNIFYENILGWTKIYIYFSKIHFIYPVLNYYVQGKDKEIFSIGDLSSFL